MTQLQADSRQGQKWIPSTKDSIEKDQTRKPDEIARKTIEVCKGVTRDMSGLYFGPDTDFPEGMKPI